MKHEFQINLGYTKNLMCAFGQTPDGVRVYTARSLRMLLRKIIKETGYRIDTIVLTFQPNPQP